jgi:hypothetical protein
MKNTFIIIVVLALIGSGYFLFVKKSSKTEVDTSNSGGQVSAKLDMAVVCNSALSYMSFPDGQSADKFVADCKEGKYPEVIERYKADMNIGTDVAI